MPKKINMPNILQHHSSIPKEVSDSLKSLLGNKSNITILLQVPVKLEIKSEKYESRILVFCPCRLFCIKVNHPIMSNPRIDFHFHYLEIQSIESKTPSQLTLSCDNKSYSFSTTQQPDEGTATAGHKMELVDQMISTILNAITETFPGIPISTILRKIDLQPSTRLKSFKELDIGIGSASVVIPPYPKSKSTSSLGPVLRSDEDSGGGSSISCSQNHLVSTSMLPVSSITNYATTNIGPCGGFSTQYAWMCDLYGLPYREEIAWDIDTIYFSHSTTTLNLNDFSHLEPKDSIPILGALEYNKWFKSLITSGIKLGAENIERLIGVVRRSDVLEELHLDNCGLKSDFTLKLSSTLSNNPGLHTLNLSHNMIEDKGAVHFSTSISKLGTSQSQRRSTTGPVYLNLSHCNLSSKGISSITHGLILNPNVPTTLKHLDLSGNSLKDDINNLLTLLAQPNNLTTLNLASTDCTLDPIFGALLRGCTSHLSHLNLSKNLFHSKKGKDLPPSFKQYLTSSLALKYLNLSNCKLSVEGLKQLLLGLACNESTADLELDISCNNLGGSGGSSGNVMESCLSNIKCLAKLDISENNLDSSDLQQILASISKNKSLKSLNLSKNMTSTKSKHISTVMDAIVALLQDDDCVLESLNLADCKLKTELFSVINAVGSNNCLVELDISANQMGDIGARLLAKALQVNTKLQSIYYDRNNLTVQGYSDIAYGLESNWSVKYVPFPLHDAFQCMKINVEKTESVMKKIQELVYRNNRDTVDGRRKNMNLDNNQEQNYFITSAEQTIDKLLNQTQESIRLVKRNNANSSPDTSATANSSSEALLTTAENLISESEKVKELLHSINSSQYSTDSQLLQSRLEQMTSDLHILINSHLESNVEQLLNAVQEKCPTLPDNELKNQMKTDSLNRSSISNEYIKHVLQDIAGGDLINKLTDTHLLITMHITDKLVDTTIESLMKLVKQLSDSNNKRSNTPDVLKNRQTTSSLSDEFGDSLHSPVKLDYLNLATPQMQSKRLGVKAGHFGGPFGKHRKLRPKSTVDCVEGISADDIPDLLPSIPRTIEETITHLTATAQTPQQLKHLGKCRPKKPKTRAPTRPSLRQNEIIEESSIASLQEGLEGFFRPSSATPTLINTPDSSDECSTSLMVSSITSCGGDENDRSLLSGTPTHSSQTFKADEINKSNNTSPSSFDSCSITSKLSVDVPVIVPRSKSTDCLEKSKQRETSSLTPTAMDSSTTPTSLHGDAKSPIPKIVSNSTSNVLGELKLKKIQEKEPFSLIESTHTKSNEISLSTSPGGTSVSETREKLFPSKELNSRGSIPLNLINKMRPTPPLVAPKPRPWSIVGNSPTSSPSSEVIPSPDIKTEDENCGTSAKGPVSLLSSGDKSQPKSLPHSAGSINTRTQALFSKVSKDDQGHSPVSLPPTVPWSSSSTSSLSSNTKPPSSSVKEMAASLAQLAQKK